MADNEASKKGGGARKVVKPVAAAGVTLGTMASIWWFALKPRRKAQSAHDAGITNEMKEPEET